jgi:hypothetical protein
MTTNPLAEGWYRDPYGIHEDRWMSQGRPTEMVRDGGRESYDPAPDRRLPEGDLVPAAQAAAEATDGSDLRRADDASSGLYDPAGARRAAILAARLPSIGRFFGRRSAGT